MLCAKETVTQDQLGIGPGIVQPTEHVVLAVFQSTPTSGSTLAPTAFANKQLVAGNVSLARLAHTTRAKFDEVVVAPKAPDQLVGVVVCDAATLRALKVENLSDQKAPPIRAVCVTDKIEVGDHEGHAALEYTEDQDLITNAGTRGRIRSTIATQLARAFGDIVSPDNVVWKADPPAPVNVSSAS